MDEFEIIRRHFVSKRNSETIIVGVGDDGAVIRPDSGRDLVTVVDTMVAGVHFPQQMDSEDIGFRAVAINLSDIAAMGARPRWMTLALTLEHVADSWLSGFARGLFAAAARYGVELIGGDTTRGREIVVSIQLTGDVEQNRSVTRCGAQPGDEIFVSGTTGDAALGLSILQRNKNVKINSSFDKFLVRRFTRPDARVELGMQLSATASAAIDVSDGLFADLDKLLMASKMAGTIELSVLPLSAALTASVSHEDALQFALSGGDDYELCFTAAPGILGASDEIAGIQVTRIGRVDDGQGLSCTEDGRPRQYQHSGYRHFDAL